MTKTLIVNCSLKTKSETLVEAISKFSQTTIVDFKDVGDVPCIERDIDAVVISGSRARIVKPTDRDMFRGVVSLIKTCDLPTLGICYGHQLLCWTFGAKVGSLAKPALDCFEKVRLVKGDRIFEGFNGKNGSLFSENHYDYVMKEGLGDAGFLLLADSPSCEVEAVKHKAEPFYGFQFHPERITVKNETHIDGHKVIGNFFRNVVKR